MIFKNFTFSEANDEFPRTQSQFRLAEQQKNFPSLKPKRRMAEERDEASFPRKTANDLSKQYDDYLQLNQGKKPSLSVDSKQSFSDVIKSVKSPVDKSSSKHSEVKELEDGSHHQSNAENETVYNLNYQNDDAFKLVSDLHYKLNESYVDPDQPKASVAVVPNVLKS